MCLCDFCVVHVYAGAHSWCEHTWSPEVDIRHLLLFSTSLPSISSLLLKTKSSAKPGHWILSRMARHQASWIFPIPPSILSQCWGADTCTVVWGFDVDARDANHIILCLQSKHFRQFVQLLMRILLLYPPMLPSLDIGYVSLTVWEPDYTEMD